MFIIINNNEPLSSWQRCCLNPGMEKEKQEMNGKMLNIANE